VNTNNQAAPWGLGEARKLFEDALAKAARGDHAEAPFPLDPEQAALWHRAQTSALQWVLEMLPQSSTDDTEASSRTAARRGPREEIAVNPLRAGLVRLEFETNQAALTQGQIGLRAMCIDASKRIHELLKTHFPNGAPTQLATPVSREEAEAFLAQYHEQVWEAAADEDSRTAYDEAGEKLAEAFLARFDPAPIQQAELSDDQVDRVLLTQIPGGSRAADWFRPYEGAKGLANVRYVVRLMLATAGTPLGFDLAAHLKRQMEWSERTFGPGARSQAVIDHIRKELKEVEADPSDLEEWIDVAALAFNGALRSGASPAEVVGTLVAKQAKCEARDWPDWRTADPNKAIEHVRSRGAAA